MTPPPATCPHCDAKRSPLTGMLAHVVGCHQWAGDPPEGEILAPPASTAIRAFGLPLVASERMATLQVRRRWWMRPICWARRAHDYGGTPMAIIAVPGEPRRYDAVIIEQGCRRCGRPRYHVGIDCA